MTSENSFRWLAISSVVALAADHLFLVTLGWAGVQAGDSPVALGSILGVAAVARAVTTMLGGLASDRLGPARVLAAGYALRGVVLAAAGLGVGLPGPHELHALAAVIGALEGLAVSPMLAAVPRLVPAGALGRANGITQGLIQLSAMLGPLLGGVLLAREGPRATLGVSGIACLVAMAIVLGGVREGQRGSAPARPEPTPDGMPTLLTYLRTEPVVRIALVVLACVYLGLLGPVQVGVPAEVKATLHNDPRWLGGLMGAFGAGLLGGTAVAGGRPPPRWIGRHLVGALVGVAAGLGVVALSPGPWGDACGLALAGAGMGYLNVCGVTWLHRHVPVALMGQVMGLVMLAANAAVPLSLWLCGWLAALTRPGTFLAGAGLVLLGAAVGGLDRRFRDQQGAPRVSRAPPPE